MTGAEFLELLSVTITQTNEYTVNLPIAVQLWTYFMDVATLPAFYFMFRHAEARALLLGIFTGAVMIVFIHMATQAGKLWSLGHIFCWLPALIYVLSRYRQINWTTLYGRWLAMMCAIFTISLIFDFRDAINFLVS